MDKKYIRLDRVSTDYAMANGSPRGNSCMVCEDISGNNICVECLRDPVRREFFHLVTYIRTKEYEDSENKRKKLARIYFNKVNKRIKARMSEEKVLEELRKIKSEVIKEVYET